MNKQDLMDCILKELTNIYVEKEICTNSIDGKTILFGGDSQIDSLELVGLIVAVEEFVLDKLGKEIQVIDEDSIIVGRTPFENAESLAELVLSKSLDGK